MKTLRSAFIAALMLSAAAVYTQETNPEVAKTLDAYTAAIKAEDVDAVVNLYHPDFFTAYMTSPQTLREALKSQFAVRDFDSVTYTLKEVLGKPDEPVVRVQKKYTGTEGETAMARTRDLVMILKQSTGGLKIMVEMGELDVDALVRETQTFASKTGGFALQYPEGWIPSKAPEPLNSIIIDGISVMTAELDAGIIFGVVQLPMRMDPGTAAKMAAQTDMASARALTQNFQMLNEGAQTLAGMPAWRIVSTFELAGEHRKRSQIYAGNESLVYFVIADIIGQPPAEREAELTSEIAAALNSFKLVAIDEGVSVAQQIASSNAEGTINGRIYQSEKFKCYLAAPENWTIRTSSNPNTLAELQRNGSNSIIRLIAAPMPKGVTAEQAFSGRIDSVKPAVRDFVEPWRGKVEISAGESLQSKQKYTLEGLGNFEVKEATIVKDGRYYLILCQAIAPDTLATLEPEFDRVINSFGITP